MITTGNNIKTKGNDEKEKWGVQNERIKWGSLKINFKIYKHLFELLWIQLGLVPHLYEGYHIPDMSFICHQIIFYIWRRCSHSDFVNLYGWWHRSVSWTYLAVRESIWGGRTKGFQAWTVHLMNWDDRPWNGHGLYYLYKNITAENSVISCHISIFFEFILKDC